MNADTATKVRISGLVRSPDREGALAHYDSERGFALVARSSMALTDVIDPTIWVREKIALSIAVPASEEDPPLKRALAAVRSIHGELMARNERERGWVSVLVALFQEGEAAAVLAGDCACYRYRDGALARLGNALESVPGRAPTGALGTETQVRIEVVPLKPRPGDLYLFSTEPMREGELARLTRELPSSGSEAALLRRSLEGAPDRGRVAVLIHHGAKEIVVEEEPAEEERLSNLGAGEVDAAVEPLTLERIDADLHRAAAPEPPVSLEREEAPAFEAEEAMPEWDEATDSAAGMPPGISHQPERDREAEVEYETPQSPEEGELEPEEEPIADGPDRSRKEAAMAPLEDERPWYEPLALWGAGALAIVALAILVRSIVPGLLGDRAERGPSTPAAPAPTGTVDLYSEPPGASIRIDGVPIERQTPAAGVALEPGLHRVELNWGPYGTWLDTVEVALGQRITLNPRVTGSVSFQSSEPSRLLDVYLDGSYIGSTPLTMGAVPVGPHLVRFGSPGATPSAQEFELYRDAPLELVGNVGAPPDPGSLTVRTALLTDEGFHPGKGDPVWIDGTLKGVTPLTLTLPPGTHSVRVVHRGYPAQVSVLEVKPGGEHFSTAEFGARSEEPLLFKAPLSLSLRDPAPLTVTLPEAEWEDSMTVWLHAAPPGGSFQMQRMTPLDPDGHTYAGLVPPTVLGNAAKKVSLYFHAVGSTGRETFSEIQTIPVKP